MFLDFLLFFLALCPFSPARLRISLWFPDVFGLFYCFSRLYVHFLSSIYSSFRISLWIPDDFGLFYAFSVLYVHFHRLSSLFLSGFRMFLDFFTLFLCFMSIFTDSVPYFSLASGCFWTFLRFFCSLCPFSSAQLHISLWLPENFGLFYCFFSLLYPYGRV